MIMNLFAFLKRLAQNNKAVLNNGEEEYVPSFWEDDYCQIEIVPIENKASILQQFQKISGVEKSDAGFTEIFVREVQPTTTLAREIRVDYVENMLTRYQFQKARYIYFDGRKLLDCISGDTKAFGFPEFTIFFDVEEYFVKDFWLVISEIKSKETINLIADALSDLAEGLDLVIVDWNSLEIIDLADKALVKRYLSNYP